MEKSEFDLKIKQLGLTIKELRINKNFTQEHLSSLCDVDVRTIQRIEKGQQNISINLLFSLSEALNLRPDILLQKIFEQENP